MSGIEMSVEVVSLVSTIAAGLAIWVLDTIALGVSVWSHDIGLVAKYREGLLRVLRSTASSRGATKPTPSPAPNHQNTGSLGKPSSRRGVWCISLVAVLVALMGFADVVVLALLPTRQTSSLQTLEGDGTCALFSGSAVATYPDEGFSTQQLSTSGNGGTRVESQSLQFDDFVGAAPPVGSDHGLTVEIHYDSFRASIPDSVVYTGLDVRPSGSVSFAVDWDSSHGKSMYLNFTDGSAPLGDSSFLTELISDGSTSSVNFLTVSEGRQHSTTLVTRGFTHDEPGEYITGEGSQNFSSAFFDWLAQETSVELLDTLPVVELAAAIDERRETFPSTGVGLRLTLVVSTKTVGDGSSGSTSYTTSVSLPFTVRYFGSDDEYSISGSGGVVSEALAFSSSRAAGLGAAVSLPITRCNASALPEEGYLLNAGALVYCDGTLQSSTVGALFEEGAGPSLTVLSEGQGTFTDYYNEVLSFFGVPPLSQVYRNLTVGAGDDDIRLGDAVFIVRREVSGLCEHAALSVTTVYVVHAWAAGVLFFFLAVVTVVCVVFRRKVASVYTAHSWDVVAGQVVPKFAASSSCVDNPIHPFSSRGHTCVYVAGVSLGPPLERSEDAVKLRWRHQSSSASGPV